MDDAETTLSGNAFQILAAATRKAWPPTADSLKEGTARRLVAADQSVCRLDTSENGPDTAAQCHGVLCRLAQ